MFNNITPTLTLNKRLPQKTYEQYYSPSYLYFITNALQCTPKAIHLFQPLFNKTSSHRLSIDTFTLTNKLYRFIIVARI